MPINNPVSGILLAMQTPGSETTVFATSASPVAWTNLDLSAYGSRQHIVMLAVKNESGGAVNDFYFRADGDTQDYVSGTCNANSINDLPNGKIGIILSATSSTGIIEWIAAANTNASIKLIGVIG